MHDAQPSRHRSQSAAGVRSGLRGAQPVARGGEARDDAVGGEPCDVAPASRLPRRALRPGGKGGAPHAGGGNDLREGARRARIGARVGGRTARLRSPDVAAQVLRRHFAPARSDDRGAAARTARGSRAGRRSRLQHAVAADRARTGDARGPGRRRGGLARAGARTVRGHHAVSGCARGCRAERPPGAAAAPVARRPEAG